MCSRHTDSVLVMQREVFRNFGYSVVAAAAKEEIHDHIENTVFDVIILNHTLSFADRKMLARKPRNVIPTMGCWCCTTVALWAIHMLTWRWTPGPE